MSTYFNIGKTGTLTADCVLRKVTCLMLRLRKFHGQLNRREQMHQNCYPTCTFPNMLLIFARKQTCYGDMKNCYVDRVLSCHSAAALFRGRVQAGVGGISRILNP
jgi:hypothetical protein